MFDFGIGQIPGFFQLGEKLVGYWKKWRQPPVPETLAGRFIRLFESHGVHRNQIPRFFGHGLQLRYVQEEAALMQCLTDAHLVDVCKLFGVERKWLERGEGGAYRRHYFYLQPAAFGRFLDELLAGISEPEVHVQAMLFGVMEPHIQVESTLVISEPIGLLNDDVIYRHHYVDGGPLGYWKSRVSTAAMVAQAIARNVWVSGRNCDAKLLHQCTYETDLLSVSEYEQLTYSGRRVEVDDWLLHPDALLAGVDPEINRFGTQSALGLWLKLDAEGQLKHPHRKPDTRMEFETALMGQNR